MKMITNMLITALYTVFVQNLVLSTGLGMSEAIRVSTKPGSFGKVAATISGFSVVTSAICTLLNGIPLIAGLAFAGRAAIYGAVLAGVYLVVAAFMKLVFRVSDKELGTMGIAALNTLVFAIPFINNYAAYTFADSIGSGIGAGFAFILAASLISKGSQAISENSDVPQIFKGTPSLLIYVGLLSLAFAGFTDSTLFS